MPTIALSEGNVEKFGIFLLFGIGRPSSVKLLLRFTFSLCVSSAFVGLRIPGVPAVRHAVGDEGAVWRDPAEEVELHLQVPTDPRFRSSCGKPVFGQEVTRCL